MAAFRKAFSNRPFVGAVVFVVFLYLFEELLFDFPQVNLIQFAMSFLSQRETLLIVISTIGSFILCYGFAWMAIRSSPVFQVLYIFIFAVSTLVQYGYWKAVERFMVAADLRIAVATPLDTWKGASLLFFDWNFVWPVIAFISSLLVFSERETVKASFVKFILFFLFIVMLSSAHIFTNKTLNLGLSFSSFSQTISHFVVDSLLASDREPITYHPPHIPQNNIVLVIDESIRGDHLGVNGYARETTPFLQKLAATEHTFYSFGLAVAGATCSYPSNALILTGVRPGLDEFEKIENYPTVFQYAKAMGYETYYMDVQANSFWNGLTSYDVAFIDSWSKARDFGNDFDSDFRAADLIAKIVSEGTGNFIVLNKRGVHFLYENSYPSQAAVWLPLPGDYSAHPNLVSNPYDNGILYNVNTFFERWLKDPNILENTTILYTSDHGQTLFESQVTWLHCNYTPQEATVPLILIGKNLPTVQYRYRASHSNILPTLLDLMAVPASQRVHSYAPSLFSGTDDSTTGQFFFDGSLRLIPFPGSYKIPEQDD